MLHSRCFRAPTIGCVLRDGRKGTVSRWSRSLCQPLSRGDLAWADHNAIPSKAHLALSVIAGTNRAAMGRHVITDQAKHRRLPRESMCINDTGKGDPG
jgi:hypothetical protein